MIKHALQYALIFMSAFIIGQLLFREEVDWPTIFGASFFAVCFHLLFSWIDQKNERED